MLHRFPCGRAWTLACAALLIFLSNDRTAAAQTSWVSQDIGNPGIAGKATGSKGNFTVTASGADIWGSTDQFLFVYQRISGNIDVRARVSSISAANAWSKAGVMIRATLDPSSAHAYMLASAAKGTAFQRRTAAGGLSTNTAGALTAPPQWVRLVRTGSLVTAYTSADGNTWTTVGSDTIALGTAAYVGLAVTSHSEFTATTAVVSNLSVLPSGQAARDVGSPALPGNATYNGGTYTMSAGGRDIWDASDQFHFVFQPAVGDIDVSARVAAIGYADQWSKVGVMIRESLSGGSRHAMALASAGKGYAFQRRLATNGVSEHTPGPLSAPPGWVRLTRVGDVFTAYVSADGKSWQAIGSDTIQMAASVYVGLAATSHNVGVYSTSNVDGLTITAAGTPPSSSAPRGVSFQESADQAVLVTGYRLDVFVAGANPATATPVASLDVGKPTPDSTGLITISVPTFFAALLPGSYQLTVVAVGPGGIGRSAPAPFTR